MRAMFALVGCLLVCLTGCGAAGGAAQSSAAAAAEPAARPAGTVRVEVAPPEGWEPVTGSVLDVQYRKGTASFMVKPEQLDGAALDEAVKSAGTIYKNAFEHYAAGEPETISVDGKDARKLAFTCTVSQIPMKFVCAFLFVGNQTYVITFGEQESFFPAIEPDIGTILGSIRFVES